MLYVVSGLTRSGTTMMMRCLEAGGLEAVWDESRNDHARRGFELSGRMVNPEHQMYEIETQRLKAEPEMYNQLGGKLIKVVAFDIVGLTQMCRLPLKVIFMNRPIDEVMESFYSFHKGAEVPIPDLPPYFFLDRRRVALECLERNGADVTQVEYRDVLADGAEVFTGLRAAGWPIDIAKACAVVDPTWRRIGRSASESGAFGAKGVV